MRALPPRLLAPLLVLCLAVPAAANVCDSGQRQSPIDIQTTTRKQLPALEFFYQPVPLKIANDGHTMRVRLSHGGSLRVGTERYSLQEFHFHTPGGVPIARTGSRS